MQQPTRVRYQFSVLDIVMTQNSHYLPFPLGHQYITCCTHVQLNLICYHVSQLAHDL
jgi:hypothetical protein